MIVVQLLSPEPGPARVEVGYVTLARDKLTPLTQLARPPGLYDTGRERSRLVGPGSFALSYCQLRLIQVAGDSTTIAHTFYS